MPKFWQKSWFYYVLAGLLVLGYLATQVHVEFPKRPTGTLADIAKLRDRDDLNVVFILVDTLRADHVSAYGYSRETTPNLDRLAATGIRLGRNVAQSSWTKTSMASIWTGTYPVTNRILRYPEALPKAVKMPAEIFRDAGYRTAGLFRNGWVAPMFGFDQGFDLYLQPSPVDLPGRFERRTLSPYALAGSDWDLTLSAQEFIRLNAHERFFLYLHYMDLHQYVAEAQSSKFGAEFVDSYDNSVHWTDRNIAAVVHELEELDIMKKTVVVIASDHGEAFYEHGVEGHAQNLYSEVLYTPVVIVLPFFLDHGLVVDELTENLDLWPTILDLVGLPPLDGAQGESLVPRFLGKAAPRTRPAFSELERSWARLDNDNPVIAVTRPDETLIEWPEQPLERRFEYFDLAADPKEQVNLANEEHERVKALKGEIDGYRALPPASWEGEIPQVKVDELRLEVLKALGYVIEGEKKVETR